MLRSLTTPATTLVALLAVGIVLSLSGCSSEDSGLSSPDAASTASPPTADPTVSPSTAPLRGSSSSNSAPGVDADEFEWEIRMARTEIPERRTSYFCTRVMMPAEFGHAYEIEPLVDGPLVHHMIIYKATAEAWEGMGDESFNCYNMPPGSEQGIVFGWAVGTPTSVFPEDIGLRLGPGSGREYCVIQTHYDNPQNLVGHEDHSGFRFKMTRKLREKNAGVMLFGSSIEPHSINLAVDAEIHQWADCPPEVSSFVLSEPIYTFWYMAHAHATGRSIWMDKWINHNSAKPGNYTEETGGHWETLFSEPYFDFDWQQFADFGRYVELKPNDEFRLHCAFENNSGKEIVGGLATSDEMCLTALIFYPEEALQDAIPGWPAGCFDRNFARDRSEPLDNVRDKIPMGAQPITVYSEKAAQRVPLTAQAAAGTRPVHADSSAVAASHGHHQHR